jgi:hypothetical protein
MEEFAFDVSVLISGKITADTIKEAKEDLRYVLSGCPISGSFRVPRRDRRAWVLGPCHDYRRPFLFPS